MVTQGRITLNWLLTTTEAEHDALLRQPHGGVGFAVHVLHVQQLERALAYVQRQLVAIFDLRQHEVIALERRAHLRRTGPQSLDARGVPGLAILQRRSASFMGDADTRRSKEVIAGVMIAVRLGGDDVAHRLRRELLDGRLNRTGVGRVLTGIDQHDALLRQDDADIGLWSCVVRTVLADVHIDPILQLVNVGPEVLRREAAGREQTQTRCKCQ